MFAIAVGKVVGEVTCACVCMCNGCIRVRTVLKTEEMVEAYIDIDIDVCICMYVYTSTRC